ncbi:YibE/F family protein [Candidatus Parcubacteria bacterium]|nr:MAG: YibE/F family protein [Candidatus Parcubacteria bacterium]
MNRKIFVIFIALLFLLSFFPKIIFAISDTSSVPKEERFEAQILRVDRETIIDAEGKEETKLSYKVKAVNGYFKGRELTINSQNVGQVKKSEFRVGDKIIVASYQSPGAKEVFFIEDYIRRDSIMWLFLAFVILVFIVGRKTGLGSLAGMAVSFLIIFYFILPRIIQGQNPVLITVIASTFIIPATYYLSHGFNLKTNIAIVGSVITLVFSGILAYFSLDLARLSGLASEEAGFIQALNPDMINMRGLLLAGILIGIIGVIDDITISQASIVFQLKKASPKLSFYELYTRAMVVGKDHIASMVNTLILVYTGASLPLLLLFIDNPTPFTQVINHEIIAEEIIRTLVASIGLVFAVPITTLLAAFYAKLK